MVFDSMNMDDNLKQSYRKRASTHQKDYRSQYSQSNMAMLDDASAIFPGEYIMCESIEGWRNVRPLVILPGSGGKPYGNPNSEHVFITCFHNMFS